MSNQRVFDFLRHQLANYPKADCLSARKGKDWQRFNTQEVLEIVDRLRQRVLRTVRRLRGRLPDAPNTPHAPTMAPPALEGND